MSGVGIDDFSMRDILRPEPPRVRRCFSAVINFAKFREERMGFFESCVQKGVITNLMTLISNSGRTLMVHLGFITVRRKRLLRERNTWSRLIENYRNRSTHSGKYTLSCQLISGSKLEPFFRLQRAEQEPTAEKLRDKNAAITADLRELQKQQTILTSESESLRKDKTDLADRLVCMAIEMMSFSTLTYEETMGI